MAVNTKSLSTKIIEIAISALIAILTTFGFLQQMYASNDRVTGVEKRVSLLEMSVEKINDNIINIREGMNNIPMKVVDEFERRTK
jgi:hypothetical protein